MPVLGKGGRAGKRQPENNGDASGKRERNSTKHVKTPYVKHGLKGARKTRPSV
jgi:hypothetical protein